MKLTSIVKLAVIAALAVLMPALVRASDSPAGSSTFDIKMPLGIPLDLWTYFVPRNNPITAAKVELGRKLFFDPRLSADGKVSCASCHDPKRAFADGKTVAEGIGGRRGTRNSPTLLNSMFSTGQFWDGRADTLEEQARMPLTNLDEMGNRSVDEALARISGVPEYVRGFEQVFGGPVTIDGFAKAIAAYERTLVSGDSPLDRYVAGDLNALNDSARNGLILFRTKARCGICHAFNQNFASFATFPFFTDGNYRNTGVAANFSGFDELALRARAATRDKSGVSFAALSKHEGARELGRWVTTGNILDIGAFRTPSLRNVELTAPYFHDGSAAALEDVVRFYVQGGKKNPNRDWQLEPVALTESEQQDLISFLKALTSDDVRRMVEAH
ncbi:MAG TPA: cytochrome c peroxidase [Blastocatellia bacterium]|nr:cytochrome c peroxidase [Blastocatellia bacterium]